MTTTKSKVSVTISENGPNIVTGDVSPQTDHQHRC